jgi:hypothetical protein
LGVSGGRNDKKRPALAGRPSPLIRNVHKPLKIRQMRGSKKKFREAYMGRTLSGIFSQMTLQMADFQRFTS